MDINIIGYLIDHRIQAVNYIIQIPMYEYLKVAENILNENEFQRKKVINSQISSLLKEDITIGCSIPPLVLAIKKDLIEESHFDYKTFDDESLIQQAFKENKLLILDGKQRTHVFLQLYKDLQKTSESSDKLDSFLANTLRIEVYVGINKLNILYRMLTLNSGQTSMSTRHLMEMLYLDYLEVPFKGIRLIPDKNEEAIANNTSEFMFKDALDGFTSYLDKDENTLERSEILDNIKSAKNIKQEDEDKFLFEHFVVTYKLFLDKISELSAGYEINAESLKGTEYEVNGLLFGKTPLQIFKRSQAISGFGAAIGELKDIRESYSFSNVEKLIQKINFRNKGYDDSVHTLIKHFDNIRDKSKKIGNDQRFYFRSFFKNLFDPESSYPQSIDMALEYAYKRTREEKSYLKDLNN